MTVCNHCAFMKKWEVDTANLAYVVENQQSHCLKMENARIDAFDLHAHSVCLHLHILAHVHYTYMIN